MLCAPAWAIEYRSVSVDAGILYDSPSTRAGKLFLLGRGYPVEVLVTLEGWAKVRDASGDLAWIEAGQLSPKRTVMVRVPRATGPAPSAKISASNVAVGCAGAFRKSGPLALSLTEPSSSEAMPMVTVTWPVRASGS